MEMIDVEPKLLEIHRLIASAVFPEDVFGKKLFINDDDDGERVAETSAEEKEALSRVLKEWKRKCDPSIFSGKYSDVYSEEAIQMLYRLFNEGIERIETGDYGSDLSSDFRINIGGDEIELRKYLLDTETAEVYAGSILINGKYGKKVIAKIASKKENNRYLENEIRVLRILSEEQKSQVKHYPPENKTFKMSDGRLGLVMEYHADFYSLEEVKDSEKWKNGIPEKHMVWMLNRALSGIGYAHSRNTIHRNLNPQNVIIRPRDHNLVFTNWDQAILNAHVNSGLEFVGDKDEYFYPSELKTGDKILPSSDLFAIKKTVKE